MSLDEIRSNFALLDDWEDRYRYVIELGRALPPLDEAQKTDATKVRGCASQVWLISRLEITAKAQAGAGTGDHQVLVFEGESDAHIVRGLIAILLAAVSGRPPLEIAQFDPHAVFDELGLKGNLTPQRSNGLASMIARIKADAERALHAPSA